MKVYKTGDVVNLSALARRYWRNVGHELIRLGYVKRVPGTREYKLERDLPDKDKLQKECVEELYTWPLMEALAAVREDVEELMCEMEEWRDNLDSADMSHLPKYDEVDECHRQLETAHDQICSAYTEMEELLTNRAPGTFVVSMPELVGRKVGTSRAARGEDAYLRGCAVVGYLEEVQKRMLPPQFEERLTSELEDAVEEIAAVDFPGMF